MNWRFQGDLDVGRIPIEFEAVNYGDRVAVERGLLDPKDVRRCTVKGIVDFGATRLVLTQTVVKRLGLTPSGKVKVRYADRRVEQRDKVEGVYVEIQGRGGTFTATVEPRRKTALVGAIVLEDLDFLADCTHQRLVPRDPKYVVSEIE